MDDMAGGLPLCTVSLLHVLFVLVGRRRSRQSPIRSLLRQHVLRRLYLRISWRIHNEGVGSRTPSPQTSRENGGVVNMSMFNFSIHVERLKDTKALQVSESGIEPLLTPRSLRRCSHVVDIFGSTCNGV
jgi:hypothetical protein